MFWTLQKSIKRNIWTLFFIFIDFWGVQNMKKSIGFSMYFERQKTPVPKFTFWSKSLRVSQCEFRYRFWCPAQFDSNKWQTTLRSTDPKWPKSGMPSHGLMRFGAQIRQNWSILMDFGRNSIILYLLRLIMTQSVSVPIIINLYNYTSRAWRIDQNWSILMDLSSKSPKSGRASLPDLGHFTNRADLAPSLT